jgi:hypothetical protein
MEMALCRGAGRGLIGIRKSSATRGLSAERRINDRGAAGRTAPACKTESNRDVSSAAEGNCRFRIS